MSSYMNEIQDKLKRAEQVQKWKIRFKKLKKRKQPGGNRMWTVAAFCAKYKLNNTQIAHAMAQRRGLTREMIDRVEAAFKSEGL